VMTERLITLTKTRARDTLGDEGRWQELMKGYAFGRAAKPEEIAWMVAFVASDRVSGYTTGSIITIDGGGSSRRSAL
jgi:3-oxoacyl-[acyl-carrier protein] reductase